MNLNIDTKGLNGRLVKNTMTTWLLVMGILLTMMAMSCKEDDPEIIDNMKPGKRDYVWSIDSVDYGGKHTTVMIESMWGSSANDVWGVAGNSPDILDCLWHYDGIKWTRATEGTPITEQPGFKVLYAIWGSSKNDVWAVGSKIYRGIMSAFIMHYDGNQWVDATTNNMLALPSILYNIYGISKNNIWVGGYKWALHYNGNLWEEYLIADSMTVSSITSFKNNIYFSVASPWGKDTFYLYQYNNYNLQIIDLSSFHRNKFGGKPWVIDSKLYSLSAGIVTTTIDNTGNIDTSNWTKEFSTETYFSERYIQPERNIFAVGQWNLVYHFNGTDWKQIEISVPNHRVDPYSLFYGVWTDGKDVFICDIENGIIYHGR